MIEHLLELASHADWPLVITTMFLVHSTNKLAHAESGVSTAINRLASWLTGRVRRDQVKSAQADSPTMSSQSE